MKKQVGSIFRQLIALLCAILIVQSQTALFAQVLPPDMQVQRQDSAPIPVSEQNATQPAPAMAPAQLDSLVAPLALYPDPLLSQVLVASTYPLEIIEAAQWVQQNPNLAGPALQDAVKQQNWDPSVQALVAFPDVLKQLSGNIQWTTQLGNAFLAQQTDVMDAVQHLRGEARSSGKLASTPQQVVTTETQGNSSVVEIEPANPQVIYVPVYNPAAIWGPPAFYPYPMIGYPYYSYIGFGAGFMMGAFFGGWGGWLGWGWHPNWFGRSIMVNNGFFSRYGYGRGLTAGFGGSGIWAHDPAHRLGVPYSNARVASQFRSGAGAQAALRASSAVRPQAAAVARSLAARSMTSRVASTAAARSFASSAPARSANSYRPSVSNTYNSRTYASSAPRVAAPTQNSRSYSTPSRAAAPQYSRAPSYSAPASHYSAPASRGGSVGHASAGHSSGHGRR